MAFQAVFHRVIHVSCKSSCIKTAARPAVRWNEKLWYKSPAVLLSEDATAKLALPELRQAEDEKTASKFIRAMEKVIRRHDPIPAAPPAVTSVAVSSVRVVDVASVARATTLLLRVRRARCATNANSPATSDATAPSWHRRRGAGGAAVESAEAEQWRQRLPRVKRPSSRRQQGVGPVQIELSESGGRVRANGGAWVPAVDWSTPAAGARVDEEVCCSTSRHTGGR
jgi:hypothetical protein